MQAPPTASACPPADEAIIQPQALAPSGETNLLGESLTGRARLSSVDALRGLVMVIMALDHTRDYFHIDAILFDPTDLTKTNPALFITRWVTHFCAPVFVFLAGTGAFLSTSRGKTKNELARFLLTRGLWLVVLELTVIHFAWWFDFNYLSAGVIWTLGWSMVVLAGLIFLPTWAVALFGVAMIASHNLSDGVRAGDFGSFHWLWTILHIPGEFKVLGDIQLKVSYPLVPWVGVMAAGFGFGKLLLLERGKRRKWLLGVGGALTLLFVVIRALNFYGDPSPWSGQKNGLFTLFSFINLEKYPPSLLFLLVTLGPAIAALALFDRTQEPGAFVRALIVFGRVPLFYYILHLFLIHVLRVVFLYIQYNHVELLPGDTGYGLPIVYLVWFAVVLLLYPACGWFAGIKKHRRDAWLSYF